MPVNRVDAGEWRGNCRRQCYFEAKRCGKEKLLPGAGDGGAGKQIHVQSGKRKTEGK